MSIQRRSRAAMSAETTARLVAVARRAFAAEGFAQVSLDALSAEAGVTRGALHHHFGNKAGLFEAVLRGIDTEIGAELAAEMDAVRAAGGDALDAFRACFHRYLDAALEPGRRRILFLDAPAVLGLRAIDILMDSGFGEIVADLRGLVTTGRIRALDPEALAHMLNGAAINLAFWAAEAPEGEDRLPRAHATLAALFDGLDPG